MPGPALSHEVILIVGATGFAGGALTRELLKRGKRVRILVRPTSDATALRSAGAEVIPGDITSAEDVARAVETSTTVYNFASPFRSAKPTDAYFRAVNVEGVRNIIAAVRRFNVGRFVHCSTIGVHGDVKEIPCRESSPYNPGDIYQQTKLEADLLLQEEMRMGFPAVIMRPCSMYGPGDTRMLKMFRHIQSGRWFTIGDGQAWFHPAYIDDLVEGFIRCGEHPDAVGGIFILAGMEPVRLSTLVQEVAHSLGVRVPTRKLPLRPLLVAARLCEGICRPLGIEPPLHTRRVRFFTNNRYFDGSHARAVLGYSPQIALCDGLKQTVAWYTANGHLAAK